MPVQEFREAVDEATALTEFCNEYTPPLDPADYFSYNTGWGSYQQTDPGKRWSYDFASPGLVQTLIVPESSGYVQKINYRRPEDLLIYYGWLSAFNLHYNNELAAQNFCQYEMVVFGNGVADPAHPDYANAVIIINRIKELKPHIKLWGYVAVTETLADFKTKVNWWYDLGVFGIFVDSAGYDYGTPATNGREAFNEKIDYVHDKAICNAVFANAWNSDHILGTANDPSYPNSTWNPNLEESHLGNYDYILLESFPINTSAWTPGYEDKAEWYARAEKILGHRKTYGVNLAAVGIINNANPDGQDLFDFGYISALMLTLQAFGTSDDYYGASSAEVHWWDRSNIIGLEYDWVLDYVIKEDANDADIYWRFMNYGKLMLDFSVGAQVSAITKW